VVTARGTTDHLPGRLCHPAGGARGGGGGPRLVAVAGRGLAGVRPPGRGLGSVLLVLALSIQLAARDVLRPLALPPSPALRPRPRSGASTLPVPGHQRDRSEQRR